MRSKAVTNITSVSICPNHLQSATVETPACLDNNKNKFSNNKNSSSSNNNNSSSSNNNNNKYSNSRDGIETTVMRIRFRA